MLRQGKKGTRILGLKYKIYVTSAIHNKVTCNRCLTCYTRNLVWLTDRWDADSVKTGFTLSNANTKPTTTSTVTPLFGLPIDFLFSILLCNIEVSKNSNDTSFFKAKKRSEWLNTVGIVFKTFHFKISRFCFSDDDVKERLKHAVIPHKQLFFLVQWIMSYFFLQTSSLSLLSLVT